MYFQYNRTYYASEFCPTGIQSVKLCHNATKLTGYTLQRSFAKNYTSEKLEILSLISLYVVKSTICNLNFASLFILSKNTNQLYNILQFLLYLIALLFRHFNF